MHSTARITIPALHTCRLPQVAQALDTCKAGDDWELQLDCSGTLQAQPVARWSVQLGRRARCQSAYRAACQLAMRELAGMEPGRAEALVERCVGTAPAGRWGPQGRLTVGQFRALARTVADASARVPLTACPDVPDSPIPSLPQRGAPHPPRLRPPRPARPQGRGSSTPPHERWDAEFRPSVTTWAEVDAERARLGLARTGPQQVCAPGRPGAAGGPSQPAARPALPPSEAQRARRLGSQLAALPRSDWARLDNQGRLHALARGGALLRSAVGDVHPSRVTLDGAGERGWPLLTVDPKTLAVHVNVHHPAWQDEQTVQLALLAPLVMERLMAQVSSPVLEQQTERSVRIAARAAMERGARVPPWVPCGLMVPAPGAR